MPTPIVNKASAVWNGDLFSGSGKTTLATSGLGTFDVNWKARAEESGGTTTPEELTSTLAALASEVGADFEATRMVEPFLIDPESGYVQALLSAYNEATGEHAKPFTQGGGTYARKFSCAASFGPEMPWIEMPEWAGGMHGPDETVPEELLKTAFKIYALTIQKLMELDLK